MCIVAGPSPTVQHHYELQKVCDSFIHDAIYQRYYSPGRYFREKEMLGMMSNLYEYFCRRYHADCGACRSLNLFATST